jgi:7-cyano-7-deazaguanine synthase in queuosine biosynthesis
VRWVNKPFLNSFSIEENAIIGKRFGDGTHCVYSVKNGCGNNPECETCEIRRNFFMASLNGITRKDVILQRAFSATSIKMGTAAG